MSYSGVAEELADRILALIPDHPEIMFIESAWDLFKVDGFVCRDLTPSLFQAQWALAKAQRDYKERKEIA